MEEKVIKEEWAIPPTTKQENSQESQEEVQENGRND